MRSICGLVVLFMAGTTGAQETTKVTGKEVPALTVIDSDGKEWLVKNWKVAVGTRRYLLQPDGKAEKLDKAGEEFIEFREENSTTLKEGILTLVPLPSVRRLEYDNENRMVTLTLGQADGKDARLKGTTKFVGINKLTIEGAVDLGGDLGTAIIKYQGGASKVKPGVREFRLPFGQAALEPKGVSYLITGVDGDKSIHTVHDIKVLYRVGGVDRLSTTLWFKETAKIPLTKILSMTQQEETSDFQLKLIDGTQLPPLALVENRLPEDGSAAELVGIIGKVPAGYKLFPMHTIGELNREGE